MLLVIGVLGTIGHLLIARAFAHAPAAMLAPFFYVHLTCDDLRLVHFWRPSGLATIIGGALIIAAGIYVYRTQ